VLAAPSTAGQPATLPWGAQDLWQQLVPLLPGLSVEVLRGTASTNSALLERARVLPEGRRDDGDVVVHRSVESATFGRRSADLLPCLLVAEHQSAGRGRQGRTWKSVSGASLTFSLGLPLAPADWSGLSLAVGVALCDALDPPTEHADAVGRGGRPRLGLKWPNDLWLLDADGAGRKLGGILIETVAAGEHRLAVIGVGLNVLPFAAANLNTGFATLRELDPQATAPAVLARVALPLVQALQRFEREGFGAFAPAFAARDLLRGRVVYTTRADVPQGTARGVSPLGALLVETPAGTVALTSGEVSVRLEDPASAA
jgi:BirA family biotin operon repressor/biotin-[acetyl-CoA-carboxylase] ligase